MQKKLGCTAFLGRAVFASLAFLSLSAGLAGPANADLILDRGLPTANLNNVSGANRSNVAWLFADSPDLYPNPYYLVGDTITNTGSQGWHVTSIRVWATQIVSSAKLWGGADGGDIAVIAPSGNITTTTYTGGATYQKSGGSFVGLNQIDFDVDIWLAAGDTFDFFLDGISDSGYTVPFVHASNAARSGSPQEGADDEMLYAYVEAGAIPAANVGTWSSNGNGWDKSSDVNVQVFGEAVPEPATLAILCTGLLGLGVLRRQRTQAH